jgi:RND family efflux transporter MFP subunit
MDEEQKPQRPELAQLKISRPEPELANSTGMGWWVWMLPVGVGLLAAAAWWLWPQALPAVSVATAQSGGSAALESVLDASGYVTARRRATVSSERTGKVKSVLIEEGMQVDEGQVLAYLDDATERAQLALAEAQFSAAQAALAEIQAQLTEAQLSLKRVEQLAAAQLASSADLDAGRAAAQALEARLNATRENATVARRSRDLQVQQLDETTIRAPFAGVVVAKTAQPGEMISPVSAGGGFTRTGICTLVDMESLEIEVDVNEAYIQRVQAGQRVTAVLDAYPDWRIPGEVIAIVPTADRQKATVKVRVGFLERDQRVLPDMGVKVAFMDAAEEDVTLSDQQPAGVLVPRSAVRTIGGSPYLYIVAGDIARRRDIDLGSVQGQTVQVLAGVVPGDRVIVAPPEDLPDGARVEVR